jgi:hypothetical protein
MTAARSEPPTTPADPAPIGTAASPRLARGAAAVADPPAVGTAALRRLARGAAAVALGLGSALAVPVAVVAAPAPCEQAEDYGAQSGAQLMHLNKLDLRPAGVDGEPTTDIGVGEAKSAFIADASINAAAVTRMLDVGGSKAPGRALVQSAPPNHRKPAHRTVGASDEGPFTLGDGGLRSRAQWDPGMACGTTTGDVTRGDATLATAAVGGELVRVPGDSESVSTTALDRDARSVAMAGMTVRSLDLVVGAGPVTVVRPATLTALMSTATRGEVRYEPAVLEVSGEGIDSTRLDTPGDDVELSLGDDTAKPGTTGTSESTTLRDLLSGVPKPRKLAKGTPLPLPAVPGLPSVRAPAPESARASGHGTRLHITLGDVRQATAGHSIAARATAFSIAITQGTPQGRDKQGYGDNRPGRTGVVLDLAVGVLEVAAVAPAPGGGGVEALTAGTGGGLPITGPRVGVLATTGVALLVLGGAGVAFAARRRRFRVRL